MGEVKIKSENLWNGSLISPIGGVNFIIKDDYMIPDPTDKDGRSWGYEFAQIKMVLPKGRYTICVRGIASTNINSGCDVYTETNVGLVKQHNLSGISLWIGNFTLTEDTNIGIMVKIFDGKYHIQLLEGTYTSETIPEYQPYFLNRPAHQFVNGQWVDIPTHHYTNGRWQGELTSQSPLKFRADGEMLDWRVEGKTSGNGGVGDWDETEQKYRIPVRVEGENLFNSETSTSAYLDVRGVEHPSEKSLTSDYISVNANTGYTLGQTGDIDNINDHAYCFYNSNKEFISSGTYTPSADGNIIRLLIPNDCAYFRFTYNHLRELVEFVEGSYTTLPPYSTTTTLYTDHQLMDGDSIDYTTTETTIPLATGNNILTVDTAVQPSKVFVKFEG